MNLTASLTSLATGQKSIITATVKDGSDNPISHTLVTFAFVTNVSTSTLEALGGVTTLTAYTDASGIARASLTAGSGSSGLEVQDTISASATDGTNSSTDAVIFTRTPGAAVGTGYVITLTPTPVSLPAGALSALVAQVNNWEGTAEGGVTVTFSLAKDNSTATLSDLSGSTTAPITAVTDASGKATAVYTAGGTSSSLEIQDAVAATLATGESDAAIITRLPTAGTGNRLFFYLGTDSTATTPTFTLASPSTDCVVTAKVTTDNGTTPVSGIPVTFAQVTGSGTVTTVNGTTDSNGIATATFTGPGGTAAGDAVVRASITGIPAGDAIGIVFWEEVVVTP